MVRLPVGLTIAGSDSGGGAGIQADLKTMEALGVFGTSAITSITAQNSQGVQGVEDISPEMVANQIDAVASDFRVGAAKTGMLSNADIIRAVAETVGGYEFPLVVDPVMIAQSGDRLLRQEAEAVLRDELIPRASLVTPNLPEAEVLAGIEVTDRASMEDAASAIADTGPDAVLVTGGHLEDEHVVDVLYAEGVEEFVKARIDSEATHGSGCMVSAAITAELAKENGVHEAVARAEVLMDRAIRYGLAVGKGYGSVHHLAGLRNDAAKHNTLIEVREAITRFERADVRRLVPESGLNFAVATPYAIDTNEIAAIEGRMTRTTDGVKANKGAWLGASSHVARFLLAIREYDPDVSTVCNLRLDNETADAAKLLLDVAEIDRALEPDDVKAAEGGTMGWSAHHLMTRREADGAPEAVFDWGEVGKEPMLKLLGTAPEEVRERVVKLAEALA